MGPGRLFRRLELGLNSRRHSGAAVKTACHSASSASRVRVASRLTGTKHLGLLLNVDVHSAQVQDRDGAETLLRQARRRFPFIERIVGDGGY